MKLSFERYINSQLFLQKYVVIFRGIRYASNVADFELTEINKTFKHLGRD